MQQTQEIRIGINVGMTNREGRGITVYTRNILGEFRHTGSDYQFVLLHNPDKIPEHKYGLSNAHLEPIPFSEKHNPWLRIANEQILGPLHQRSLGLDVIWHPHNRCQFFTPVGYVATMHDVLPIAQPELAGGYLDSLDKKALNLSRIKTASRVDKIIAVSEFTRREIIEHLNVNPENVVTIHNGIDQNTYKPNRDENAKARIKSTYSLSDRYILTTGSYAPHKNLQVLVDAYAQSNLPKENVGLVTVGPNDATGYARGYKQLEAYVRQRGLSDRVKMLPSVPLNDLVAIYSNADIYAITSKYEGFGLTPLEAMACEVPVVASNVSAIPEVCGNASLYADPEDVSGFATHLNTLLENGELRHKLIEAGRSQVSKFSWQTTARETLQVLIGVANARK